MNPEFKAWLADNGFDAAALEAPEHVKQRKHLETAWKADTQPERPPVARLAPTEPVASVEDKLAIYEAEARRKDYINERCATLAKMYSDRGGYGDSDKLKMVRELRDAAHADEKMDARAFDLAVLRLERQLPPMAMPGNDSKLTQDVIEAAVCMTGRLGDDHLAKEFNEHTLNAAHRQFKHGIGLQDLFMVCAQSNGYRGRGSVKSDISAVFRAACGYAGGGHDMYSAGGAVPSTYSLPNVVSNVANKFLRVGFESVDRAWREISAIGTRTDFKSATTVALTGSSVYAELPPSGEIKHGTLGETTYANQVKTYAKMIGLDRQHIINDDIGALTGVSRRIGIDAARTINYIFWGVFLNNSSFFTSGNANVITGGTSVLASAGLKLADAKFRMQTDPDGLPAGYEPAILLVPPTLLYTARELMTSSALVGTTTANSLLPATNIFSGAYRLVTSPYMENTTLTGNSTAAWYLLAEPTIAPVIETVFLNGKDTPTVESTDLDFNMLGVATRAYIDFGVALQEYRGGVRAAGS